MSEIKKWGDPSIQVGDTVDISNIQEKSRQDRLSNGWISVSNKLPEEYKRVLVCLDGEVFNNQVELAERIDGIWYFGAEWSNEYVSAFVTHWMPLPEPPKTE